MEIKLTTTPIIINISPPIYNSFANNNFEIGKASKENPTFKKDSKLKSTIFDRIKPLSFDNFDNLEDLLFFTAGFLDLADLRAPPNCIINKNMLFL